MPGTAVVRSPASTSDLAANVNDSRKVPAENGREVGSRNHLTREVLGRFRGKTKSCKRVFW